MLTWDIIKYIEFKNYRCILVILFENTNITAMLISLQVL